MSRGAKVTSVSALRDLKAAVQRFIDETGAALTEVEADAIRTAQWLRFDQNTFWQSQVRQRHEAVESAKSELRKKQFSGLQDNPTAIEHRRLVDRARRREEAAVEKAQHLRRWLPTLERETTLYKGAIQPLADAIARDLPAAILRLEKMAATIEAYAQVRAGAPPEGLPRAVTPTPEDESAAARYAALRRRAPRVGTRLALDPAPAAIPIRRGGVIAGPEGDLLTYLGVAAAPPAPTDLVTVQEGSLSGGPYFLHRAGDEAPDDSGWHIGSADPFAAAAGRLDALTIADLLAARPALAPLLNLPRGYLITISSAAPDGSGTIESILDPDDRLAFP